MMPQPLQRKRTKGFRYPEGAKVLTVTRGTVYGNPYKIVSENGGYFVDAADGSGRLSTSDKSQAARFSVIGYEKYMDDIRRDSPAIYAAMMRDIFSADYVACWCALDAPCHRSVLIKLATEWAATHAP